MTAGMLGALAQSMAPALLARLSDIAQERGGLDELAREATAQVWAYVPDPAQREQLVHFVRLLADRMRLSRADAP